MTPIAASASFIADAHGVDHAHTVIQQFLSKVGADRQVGLGDEWTQEFVTAIGELISNIARHAYRGTDVRDAWITIDLSADAERLRATLRDGGVPFTGDLAPTDHADEQDPLRMLESGRGFRIIRRAVDDLAYQRTPDGYNCWRIEKRS